MTDIFEFWSRIKRGENIHPDDKSVFARMNAKRHGFRTDCLPACFGGRLRTAPVVLLYLSPGFSSTDLKDANTDEGKDYFLKRWSGHEPFRDKPEAAGASWLKSRTKDFASYDVIRERFAVLNIGAYHSTAVQSYSSLLALPSSRVSISWAQNVLFPDAEAGKRIVVCMRSAAHWGLDAGKSYGRGLFAPHITRAGYLVNNEENKRLKEIVRKALLNN